MRKWVGGGGEYEACRFELIQSNITANFKVEERTDERSSIPITK